MGNRNVPELTEENLVRFFRSMKALHEEGKPLPNYKCKTEGCGGDVARRVLGCSGGMFLYHIAACLKCGRQYQYAGEGVPTIGEKEFVEIMNTPFTL